MNSLLLLPILAQAPAGAEPPIATPMLLLMALTVLALTPFLLMMTTSFVKIAVVLSLIRQAIGTQQIPPNQVVTGLSLILTIYIMTPVAHEVYRNVESVIRTPGSDTALVSTATFDTFKKALDLGKEPVRQFLIKHAAAKDRSLFYNLARQLRGSQDEAAVGKDDFSVLMPAFVITELTEAFQIGFIIFLPFLVIDMVVSNVLLAMGMFMVSPVTISLPFKLLLFVLVDGWHLITKGLVLGYIK